MIDRPTLLRMTKEERDIVIVQSMVSMADSLAAIKEEVIAMRGALSAQDDSTAKKK